MVIGSFYRFIYFFAIKAQMLKVAQWEERRKSNTLCFFCLRVCGKRYWYWFTMYAIQKAPFGVYYFATEAQKEQRRKYEMRIHFSFQCFRGNFFSK